MFARPVALAGRVAASRIQHCTAIASTSKHYSDTRPTTTDDSPQAFLSSVLERLNARGDGRKFVVQQDAEALQRTYDVLGNILKARKRFEKRRGTTLMDALVSSPALLQRLVTHPDDVNGRIEFLRSCELTTSDCLMLLASQPQLLANTNTEIYAYVDALFTLGMTTELMVRTVRSYPQLFTQFTPHQICQQGQDLMFFFTKNQIAHLVHKRPQLLGQDFVDITDRVEYMHYEMGATNTQIASTHDWIDMSLEEIQLRHAFVRQTGTFTLPNPKKPDASKNNPPFKDIFSTDVKKFAEEAARVSVFEWEVFCEMYRARAGANALNTAQIAGDMQTPKNVAELDLEEGGASEDYDKRTWT